MTSLNDIKQIGIMTFDLQGQGGQMEVKITKSILIYLLKIWYVSLVGDSKLLKTLTFDLGGHWRSKYKNLFSSYATKPLEILYLSAFSATWPY